MKRLIGTKMTIAFALVASGAVALTALLINLSVATQFSGYLRRSNAEFEDRIVDTLEDAYETAGNWTFLPALSHYARMNAVAIEIFDIRGRRLFLDMGPPGPGPGPGPTRGMPEVNPSTRGITSTRPLIVNGKRVGTVKITPLGRRGLLSAQDLLFRRAVNTSVWGAAILAVLAAMTLAAFFAKPIVDPIRKMNAAAERLAAGELETEVPIETDDELADLGRTLNMMSARLLRLETLRRRLTQDVAHELRTPLTVARGMLEGMQDGVIPASPENLATLTDEIDRLSRLVRDLNDLAQAESQATRLTFARGHVLETAEAVVRRWAPLYDQKAVRLEGPSLPGPSANFDREAMERVFDNLLGNALWYTPPGGCVSLDGREGDDGVEIRVADNGAGIEAEHLPYIFERFYRADPSRSRETGGTGIGLAIVRELISAHGGQVFAESAPGSGTTIIIRLPHSHET